MRRLFWTFPDGLPGIGLLLLRIALSAALVDGVLTTLKGDPSAIPWALAVAESLSAAGLLVGSGTPFWAAGTAAIEAWRAGTDPGAFLLHGLMASISVSLALLGPGAASVDARMFGWQRLEVRGPRR